jgi:DNA primase
VSVLETVKPFLRQAKVLEGRVSAICPFHDDRNPSFSMSLEPGKEGLYFCFSCHASGNLAMFLRKMKLSPTAIERVTRELSIRSGKSRYKQVATGEESFLPESILGAFHSCPITLLDAGFTMETLEAYGVGFDEARQRITFPLRNEWGQLIGISGRSAYDAMARYYVYTEKEFPNFPGYRSPKKDFIWNMDKVYARYIAGKVSTIHIVEGFKVCMWLTQAGVKDTVALLGSMLTAGQRKLLERVPCKFVLALDNDEAGKGGAHSIGRQLQGVPGVNVRVIDHGGLDRMDVHQLDELDRDDLQRVLEKNIPLVKFLQLFKQKEKSYEPRF